MTSAKTCSIDDCGRPLRRGGMCQTHYHRSRTGRDLHAPIRDKRPSFSSPEEAFAHWTRRNGECVEWTGSIGGSGYGRLTVRGERTPAHRYAWERENGPIPDGLVVDHRCINRTCVNVDHLRVVTQGENVRAQSARGRSTVTRRGVRRRANGKWQARVRHDNREYASTHETEEAAAAAVHAMWVEHFGEDFVANDWEWVG